jgi:hypothetical protein
LQASVLMIRFPLIQTKKRGRGEFKTIIGNVNCFEMYFLLKLSIFLFKVKNLRRKSNKTMFLVPHILRT